VSFWAVAVYTSQPPSRCTCSVNTFLNDTAVAPNGNPDFPVESSYTQLSIQIGTFNNPTSFEFRVSGLYCPATNLFLDDFAITIS
jgi:hypothetical protein